MTTDSIARRIRVAEECLQTLYGDNSEGFLSICWPQDGNFLSKCFDARQFRQAARFAIEQAGEYDTYFGVGLRGQKVEGSQRGASADVNVLPGMWGDIDIKSPAHKNQNLPPTKDD